MLPYLSKKITSSFITREIIKAEDQEIYAYSFEILLATLLNFLCLCLLALITGTVWETAFYLLSFLPLRQFVGGYHAKNHLRCFFILVTVYGAFLLLLFFLPTYLYGVVVLPAMIVSLAVVFVFAPVADENKPLSLHEVSVFKRNSRIAIIIYSMIIGLLFVFPIMQVYSLSLSLGALSVALSLVASVLKQQILGHSLLNSKN